MDKALEVAKEIEQIALENNISVNDLLEQYKKAQSLATTQGKEPNIKILNDILSDKVEIDNYGVYDETGENIGDLI